MVILLIFLNVNLSDACVSISNYLANEVEYKYELERAVYLDFLSFMNTTFGIGVKQKEIFTNWGKPFQLRHAIIYSLRRGLLLVHYTHVCNHGIDRSDGNKMQWNVVGFNFGGRYNKFGVGIVKSLWNGPDRYLCEYRWVYESSAGLKARDLYFYWRLYALHDKRIKPNMTIGVRYTAIRVAPSLEFMHLYDIESFDKGKVNLFSFRINLVNQLIRGGPSPIEVEASYSNCLWDKAFDWHSNIGVGLRLLQFSNFSLFMNTNISTLSPEGRHIPRRIEHMCGFGIRLDKGYFIELGGLIKSRHSGDVDEEFENGDIWGMIRLSDWRRIFNYELGYDRALNFAGRVNLLRSGKFVSYVLRGIDWSLV